MRKSRNTFGRGLPKKGREGLAGFTCFNLFVFEPFLTAYKVTFLDNVINQLSCNESLISISSVETATCRLSGPRRNCEPVSTPSAGWNMRNKVQRIIATEDAVTRCCC